MDQSVQQNNQLSGKQINIWKRVFLENGYLNQQYLEEWITFRKNELGFRENNKYCKKTDQFIDYYEKGNQGNQVLYNKI